MSMGEYVDAFIASVTAQMEVSQREREDSSVERASAPVVYSAAQGVNTTEGRSEERDAESPCNDSNENMVLTQCQSYERKNEAQQAQMSDPDPREQLQVID